MVQLPNNFAFSSEGNIASYDGMDFIAKVGYKKFYCGTTLDSVATRYITGINQFEANPPFTLVSASAATEIDLDFDLTFSAPAILGGEAYLNVTFELFISAGYGGGPFISCAPVYTLYKVAIGGAETSIVAKTDATFYASVSTQYLAHRRAVSLTIPNTHFTAGEKLRLNIVANAVVTGGPSEPKIYLWHDPSSRMDTYGNNSYALKENTDLTLTLPFKIDL